MQSYNNVYNINKYNEDRFCFSIKHAAGCCCYSFWLIASATSWKPQCLPSVLPLGMLCSLFWIYLHNLFQVERTYLSLLSQVSWSSSVWKNTTPSVDVLSFLVLFLGAGGAHPLRAPPTQVTAFLSFLTCLLGSQSEGRGFLRTHGAKTCHNKNLQRTETRP